ncbi:cation transport protein-domain-containing protein [Thelonectria olida]|uniref:Potassium transport protein n=1 Tax=Thelonectria olida TaxID=1576542 RepID=A0A9P8W3M8_9HYPO|nr:cation transport protein-domain-containing protein [Thelonectria olida]
MFASGANTQAGLNPDDLNILTTFQQIVIYLFTMLSNPITLHSSVVFLRLYWFEKRFQGWVKDARTRRGTLSKAKSRARNEERGAEEGVNGRNITVIPTPRGRPLRMTNDGILLEGNDRSQSQAIIDDDDDACLPAKTVANTNSSESDTATVSGGRSNSMELSHLEKPEQEQIDSHIDKGIQGPNQTLGVTPTAITFADTVKRSNGMDDDLTKFPQKRTNAEHIAILERQRHQDQADETLFIPGPRDIERGMGPRRVEEGEPGDDDDNMTMIRSNNSRQDSRQGNAPFASRVPRERRPTIVIAEPERPVRDDTADDAKTAPGNHSSFRFRKPRTFSRGHHKRVLEDNESGRPVSAFRTRTIDTIRTALTRDTANDMPYLSYTPTMGRNSNFLGLTTDQREELGGIEYRSLRTLAVILIFYFWGFQILAAVCLIPFILNSPHYASIVDEAGVSKVWWGFFTSNSAFMDLGFTLTPDSMNSFNTSEYIMMVMWFFIIIGNTGFPVMLRFIIWVLSKVVPTGSGVWEELRFLLDHPRRCFTLLFPSSANWWLFWILVGLNIIDLVFFIVLDLNSPIVEGLPLHTRIADGLFQAAATRTAGFSCFSMSALHPAMPVLYMIMMYISIFPIAISIRRTNVYEEKSLGVYRDKNEEGDNIEASALTYVSTHLRRQLSFDLWYVFVGFFFLAITEGNSLKAGDFNLFDILFEVISAYGTVGLSMGGSGYNAALCSQFTVVGKLIIVAMQIRGRHRGLPYGLDRAILLPSEARFQKEAEMDQPILVNSHTMGSTSGIDYQVNGSVSGRRRSVSRGRDRERANSHIITQFLYPGPVIRNDAIHGHKRTQSGTSQQDFPRAVTEPAPSEEKDEVGPLRPIESHNFHAPRKAETMPFP